MSAPAVRRPRPRRGAAATVRRGRALGLVGVAGLLALSGCTGDAPGPLGPDGPDPEPAAEALAAALAAGRPGDAGVTGGSDGATGSEGGVQEAYDAVVAGLGEVSPDVVVTDVEREGDTATATLSWSWPLAPATTWTYESTATLTLTGDTWSTTWSPALVEPSLRDGEVLDAATLTPRRGQVLGARGARIVTDRPVTTFGIDRSQVPRGGAGSSADELAALVGVDALSYRRRVVAAGPKAFVPAITFRTDEVPAAAARGFERIAGARAIAEQRPLAPTRTFLQPLLGTVGEATAELIAEDPETYHLGDVVGLSGLQARYDESLRGTPGVEVDAVSTASGTGRELFQQRAVPGSPLRLTIDPRLESLAERALAGVGPASALVAVRPSDGAILAAANGPGSPTVDLATYGQAAPGSTFKIVTSLALLRAGLTPSSLVPCTPSVTVDGKVFSNYDDYPSTGLGRIPLRSALANSCNTAFISQRGRLRGTDLFDAGVSLGMGLDHDLGFPAYFGSIEPAASETGAAADLIGQGTILASPMVMATVVASVQAGQTVVPHLVDGTIDGPPEGAQPLTAAEAEALRTMLRGVVTDGSGRGLLDVPGAPVIAKTGTAEFEVDGRVQTHAWMVAAQGDLAVAVYVDLGESGSGTAGPILEEFLRGARP